MKLSDYVRNMPPAVAVSPCYCIGPQNGQPRCPCAMRGVVVRNGRYIQMEVALGPASNDPRKGLGKP